MGEKIMSAMNWRANNTYITNRLTSDAPRF